MRAASIVPAIAAGLVVLGCTERGGAPPSALRLNASATVSTTCSFTVMNSLVSHYFSSTEAKAVRDLIDQMQAATDTATRRNRGFDVMTHIASNVKAGNPDFQDASDLTNALLACMFFSPAELPATFPEDFTVATNPSLDGAYDVRGGAFDPATDVVFARSPGTPQPFSGVAPPLDATGARVPWATILSSNPAPKRLLLYGRPGSTPQSYDWKIVPRNAVFAPQVVVGLCADPTANATSMVAEEHVGYLTFVVADFLTPGMCSPVASAASGGVFQFARRVTHGLGRLFAVTPAWAAISGGVGGSTGGIGSEFNAAPVQATLSFVVQPSDVELDSVITPPVVVQALDATTGKTIGGVQVTLEAVNNNGVPAQLLGDTTETTGNNGLATFSHLSLTKTGGYAFVASGTVAGRTAVSVTSATSQRFNVRP